MLIKKPDIFVHFYNNTLYELETIMKILFKSFCMRIYDKLNRFNKIKPNTKQCPHIDDRSQHTIYHF